MNKLREQFGVQLIKVENGHLIITLKKATVDRDREIDAMYSPSLLPLPPSYVFHNIIQ